MDGQRSRQHSPLRVSSVDNRLHQLQIQFDRDELVRLTLDLCNIESPAGREAEVGNFVFEWMQNEGFEPKKIGIFPDRFKVIGTLAGAGDGYSPVCARLALDILHARKAA
jgi:hypothetical protein